MQPRRTRRAMQLLMVTCTLFASLMTSTGPASASMPSLDIPIALGGTSCIAHIRANGDAHWGAVNAVGRWDTALAHESISLHVWTTDCSAAMGDIRAGVFINDSTLLTSQEEHANGTAADDVSLTTEQDVWHGSITTSVASATIGYWYQIPAVDTNFCYSDTYLLVDPTTEPNVYPNLLHGHSSAQPVAASATCPTSG